MSAGLSAIGFESITVSTTAIGCTTATAAGAIQALVTVEDQAIRYRVDGTNPTSSVGHEALDYDVITLQSPDEIAKFKAIRRDSSDAILRVTYFR